MCSTISVGNGNSLLVQLDQLGVPDGNGHVLDLHWGSVCGYVMEKDETSG